MRLFLVFQKTFLSMLGCKRTTALVAMGVLVPVLFIRSQWSEILMRYGTTLPLPIQTQLVTDLAARFWYIWGAGFLISVMLVATAAGFIAGEVSEGTMMVLAAKPVKRYQIVLGKLLALMVYSLLLLAFIYTFSTLLLSGILRLDADSLQVLLSVLPVLLLYALLVAFFFGSITTALSVLTASRVKIMVVCMVLVILAFLVGRVVRDQDSSVGSKLGPYSELKLYTVDIGYHMGNTYDLVTGAVSFWDMSPQQLRQLGLWTGTYTHHIQMSTNGVVMYPGVLSLPNRNSHMQPELSLMILLLVSGGASGLAVWRFNRKQL